jgi:hypothetical protein
MNSFVINRFDKTFGPVGSSAGYFLLVAGIVLSYFSATTLFVAVLGAFLAFTNTLTIIDYSNKRVRFCSNICGFLKFGNWLDIQSNMKLKIVSNHLLFRSYSSSNRTLDIKTHRYQVVLCQETKGRIMPLQYTNSLEEAKKAIDCLAHQLQLEIIH